MFKTAAAAGATLVAGLVLTVGASAKAPAPLVPIALVEDITSTTADVEFMDYVGTGQVIKLAPKDTIVLSYLKSCQHETITGGIVKIGAERSDVQGGTIKRAKVPCNGGKMQLASAEANASGASSFRLQSAPINPLLYSVTPMIQLPRLAAGDPRVLIIERMDKPGSERAEIAIDEKNPRLRRSCQDRRQAAVARRRLPRHRRPQQGVVQDRRQGQDQARPRWSAACCASRPVDPIIARMDSLRAAAAAFVISLVAALIAVSPALDAVRGLSVDILTALRWRAFGNAHDPAASPTVVVALDEETFRTPPFDGTPSVTWTREIGQVLTALIDGGAKVVGFDIVFPTSIEQSGVPFGEETLGARVRGFDRDYLRALALGARAGKVVLGQVQHARPSGAALAGPARRGRPWPQHPRAQRVQRSRRRDPPHAAHLHGRRRAGAVDGGGARRARRPEVPPRRADFGRRAEHVHAQFRGRRDDIPTFSLADLRACAEKGDKEFFRRAFRRQGRADRHLARRRGPQDHLQALRHRAGGRADAPRCALPRADGRPKFTRNSISGVYIHATAVNNLLRGDALTEFGRARHRRCSHSCWRRWRPRPRWCSAPRSPPLAALGIVRRLDRARAIAAFRDALALPLIEPGCRRRAALGVTIGYRFVVADRDKRLLRQSFALYLAPAVIEKMIASNKPPALGGEMRNVTVYFSDIADFSSIAEKIDARAELVAAMNEYLSAMTDIIESARRLRRQVHRRRDRRGVRRAARRSRPRRPTRSARRSPAPPRLAELDKRRARRSAGPCAAAHRAQHRRGAGRQHRLAAALQLHGDGRHGEPRLAARGRQQVLRHHDHGLGDDHGTRPATTFAWRELDAIQVKGRNQAVKIYEPLGPPARCPPDQAARAAAYAEGLARYRARDFAGALEAFSRCPDDPPAGEIRRAGAGTPRRGRPGRTGSRSTRWTRNDAARRHARVFTSTFIRKSWMAGTSPAMTLMGDPRPSQNGTASAIFNP